MSDSNIPYSVRGQTSRINQISGFNFNDISTDTLIKKVDANNAGNSNIISSYTATGSVTTLINGDPDNLIPTVGGQIITSIDGAERQIELTVGAGSTKRSIIIQENQPVIIENDLSVVDKLYVGGTINLNGLPGNAGDVLTSNGASDPTWSPPAIPTPYYIELDIGDSGGGAIFSAPAAITTTINTLTALSTPIPYYNSDLINSSTWSPSVAGLYLINYKALIRSVNADYLVEATTALLKKQSNGVFTNININNVRNWGSSVNEVDARVFTMTLPLTTTVYANIGDEFRFTFYGRSYFNNAIWLLTNPDTSNMTITKLL